MNTILGREPVLILGLLRAVVVLGVAFGLSLNTEQMAAVYIVMEMAISVIARQRVTPEASPVLPAGTDVKVTNAATADAYRVRV